MVRFVERFCALKSGVAVGSAAAAMNVLYHSVSVEELGHLQKTLDQRGRERYVAQKLDLRPATQGVNLLRGQWETALVSLMAMVGLVLLIACANIAGARCRAQEGG